MTKRWGWRWLLALALMVAASQATAEKRHHLKSWAWTFEADTLGKEPDNSGVATGTWEVADLVPDSAAAVEAAGGRILRQLEGEDGADYHMLQLKKPIVEDLVASVRFRVVSGEVDPGGEGTDHRTLHHLWKTARHPLRLDRASQAGRMAHPLRDQEDEPHRRELRRSGVPALPRRALQEGNGRLLDRGRRGGRLRRSQGGDELRGAGEEK